MSLVNALRPASVGSGTITPYFQPIVSVADGKIFAYEILGRLLDADGSVRSMGAFFHDENIPDSDKIQVDRQVRELAFRTYRQSDEHARLFVNIHPSWIYEIHKTEQIYPTIRLLESIGLSGENVVIEITEERFLGADFEFLNGLIDRYRDVGIKIAIDDFSFPNFDRLISIKPDFVKIDIQLVKKGAENEDYKKLCTTIANFCQDLGIAVIFEGVETLYELENSMESGASFVQGFFFSESREHFQDPNAYNSLMQLGINNVTYRALHLHQNIVRIEQSMNRYLALVIQREHIFEKNNLDDAVARVLPFLPPQCFRVYVCDGRGLQLSANFARNAANGRFTIQPEHRGKNWGWRPYFFGNLVRMQEWNRGVISHKYVDVETRRPTLTFSYPIDRDLFIFLDFVADT